MWLIFKKCRIKSKSNKISSIYSFLSNDLVDPNVVVIKTSEKEVSALVPCQAGAADWGSLLLLVSINWGGLDVNNELLGWEIPDLDTVIGTQNEPVVLGGEENAVDWAVNFFLSEEFTFNEVPDDGNTVFTT